MTELIRFIEKTHDWFNKLQEPPYHLKIKKNGNLYCFHYGALSDSSYKIVCESRGIILEIFDNTVKIVCYPFDRFFNYEEQFATPISEFINDSTMCIEKMDGTMIKLFWYNNKWSIATKGCCDASPEFEQLFTSVFNDYTVLNKDCTYIFELVGPTNKIVVTYTIMEVYHIGARNNITLEELDVDIGVKKPKQYNFTTVDNLINTVKQFNPHQQEGVVLVCKKSNGEYIRLKVKNAEYIAIHHMVETNDKKKTPFDQLCIKLILNGDINEFLVARPEMMDAVDDIRIKFDKLVDKIDTFHKSFSECKTLKEFASKVTKSETPIHSIHFELFHKKYNSVKDAVYCMTDYKKIANLLEKSVTTEYNSYVIFGSPDSADLDVAVFINSKHKFVQFNDSKMRNEINTTKELDVNRIIVDDNGAIVWCQKGCPQETQNIIFFTYKYHEQKYENPIKSSIKLDMIDPEKKIKALFKYFLDYSDELCSPEVYTKIKKQKDVAYTGTVQQRIDVVQELSINMKPFSELKTHMKAIMLKLCQIWLYEQGELEYNKLLIPDKMTEFDANSVKWFLSRQSYQEPELSNFTFQKLLKYCCDTAVTYTDSFKWITVPVVYDTYDKFMKLFMKNACNPTDELIELFIQKTGGERRINKIFMSDCFGSEKLPKQFVEEHVCLVNQRSDEWKQLLQFYKCGRNSGVQQCPYNSDHEYIKFYWNLIRGNIAEQLVTSSLNGYEKIQVGLLVEENSKGAVGVSPDLLIVKDGFIVPVEIKSVSSRKNSELKREISLAKRQLATSRKILGKLSRESCIIVVYFDDNNIVTIELTFFMD